MPCSMKLLLLATARPRSLYVASTSLSTQSGWVSGSSFVKASLSTENFLYTVLSFCYLIVSCCMSICLLRIDFKWCIKLSYSEFNLYMAYFSAAIDWLASASCFAVSYNLASAVSIYLLINTYLCLSFIFSSSIWLFVYANCYSSRSPAAN